MIFQMLWPRLWDIKKSDNVVNQKHNKIRKIHKSDLERRNVYRYENPNDGRKKRETEHFYKRRQLRKPMTSVVG